MFVFLFSIVLTLITLIKKFLWNDELIFVLKYISKNNATELLTIIEEGNGIKKKIAPKINLPLLEKPFVLV